MVSVKCKKRFTDLIENKVREVNDVFKVSQERFDLLKEHLLVELVESEKTGSRDEDNKSDLNPDKKTDSKDEDDKSEVKTDKSEVKTDKKTVKKEKPLKTT